MSDNSNSTRASSRLGRYKYVWLLLLPLIILLAIAAYWGISELNAANSNRAQFEQWAEAGIPYDNATLQKDYDERTHPEGASDWIESTKLIEWGREVEAYQQLPYLGWEGQEPVNLVPGGDLDDWPGEPQVASYLKEMEPVIDLIERASSHPTPVRFPTKFQGMGTLLPQVQESRSILRLLSLDCDFAYFNEDNERALRDLSLMQATAEAFDGRECLVSNLVNVALRGIRMSAMRRTLSNSQWSAAELEILRDSLKSKEEIPTRWQDIMLRERAFGLSIVGESPETLTQSFGQDKQFERPFKFLNGPTELKTLMEAYQRIIELPIGPDVNMWRKRGDAIEEWLTTLPSNSLAGLLMPASSACLESEIRVEGIRRWTLTAVAIQQFKQQHERWPKDLAELEMVGLVYEDYSNMEKNIFGYEIEGDKVFLWRSNDMSDDRQISRTRPVPERKYDGEEQDQSHFIMELN